MKKQLIEQINDVSPFDKISHIFGLLGDSSRLRIFWFLCHCEECVLNISTAMSMTSPAVSHHLKQLKTDGLIVSRRDGKEVFYRASDRPESIFLHESIEKIMEISCPNMVHDENKKYYRREQLQVISQIHDYLIENLDKHITIDQLSSMFHMNSTTIKKVFKEVYGNSIASHTKEHRMEYAASLLNNSNLSIAEIAGKSGYGSQSKFTSAFQSYYNILPSEYRKGVNMNTDTRKL